MGKNRRTKFNKLAFNKPAINSITDNVKTADKLAITVNQSITQASTKISESVVASPVESTPVNTSTTMKILGKKPVETTSPPVKEKPPIPVKEVTIGYGKSTDSGYSSKTKNAAPKDENPASTVPAENTPALASATNQPAKPKALSNDEINKVLIDIKKFKHAGLNCVDLIRACIIVGQAHDDLLEEEDNESQIEFAKHVWNEMTPDKRHILLKSANQWFLTAATDARLAELIGFALDNHNNQGTNSAGAKKYNDYMQICQRYNELKARPTGPFDEPFTKRELIFMAKFEDLKAKRDQAELENPTIFTPKHPNQNAVTYPFILAKFFRHVGMDFDADLEDNVKLALDLLNYIAVHGQTTAATFQSSINQFTEIIGPASNKDLKPMFQGFFDSGNLKAVQDRNLPNYHITLQRLVRLVHICTPHHTPWGILGLRGEEFITRIKRLYELEVLAGKVDKKSLAMIWYLCIGRGSICSVMVDHHEESAANVMATILGKTPLATFTTPAHVFPWDKDTGEQFDDFVSLNL